MKTLYDLLGALPNDDAEALRTAFRSAVKGAHPDIRPGDPDAALRFRQIVRANEILRDPEQRAAYDHLLDLAHVEHASASTQAIATRIYKLAFGLVGLAGGSVGTIGVYLLLMHLSAASLAPPPSEAETATQGNHPVEMAALARSAPQDVSQANPPTVKDDSTSGSGNVLAPHVVNSQTITESAPAASGLSVEADASEALRARGITAYRNGDLDGAMADLDQAIQLNPKFAAAYIDRGIVLYRMQKFDRALADVARAKQIEGKHPEKPGHSRTEGAAKPESVASSKPEAGKPESVVARKQRTGQAANRLVLSSVLQRRASSSRDASHRESQAFLRMR